VHSDLRPDWRVARNNIPDKILMPSKTAKPIDIPHCRERALECVREAERAAEPALKKTYLDMARAWLNRADDLTNGVQSLPSRRR
jgi:hypothetical protein